MTTPTIANLEKLIGGPRDGALVRYALGNEWLKVGDPIRAIESLRAAVAFDTQYSAAWKQLGKSLASTGQTDEALEAFRQGIDVATARGDIQAAREMAVFVKRLSRGAIGPKPTPGDQTRRDDV